MKLRLYAAVVTGCLADILAMSALWLYTDFVILDVVIWGTVAYLAGIFVVLWKTEPKKAKVRKHTIPQIYTLRKAA